MWFCLVTENVSGERREGKVSTNLTPGINHSLDTTLETPQVFVVVIASVVGMSFGRVAKRNIFLSVNGINTLNSNALLGSGRALGLEVEFICFGSI